MTENAEKVAVRTRKALPEYLSKVEVIDHDKRCELCFEYESGEYLIDKNTLMW